MRPVQQDQNLLALVSHVLDCVEALRQNQMEPDGKPTDEFRENRLRNEISQTLLQVAELAPTPYLKRIAEIRAQWILLDDDLKKDELVRELVNFRTENSPIFSGIDFDVGFLVADSGMQRRISRRDARRYSGWIASVRPDECKLMEQMPALTVANRILPAEIQPTPEEESTSLPPTRYNIYDILRFAGEASRTEHIANYWPEDEGTPHRGKKWSSIYINIYSSRFRHVSMALSRTYNELIDVSDLSQLREVELERQLLFVIRGHDLGHFSGPTPMRLRGYPGIGDTYLILEELRAEANWLWMSAHLQSLFHTEREWHTHQRVFWADAIRYISLGFENRSDPAAEFLNFNFMRIHGAIQVNLKDKIEFNFNRMKHVLRDLVIQSNELILKGTEVGIISFFKNYGFDYATKSLIQETSQDPFFRMLTRAHFKSRNEFKPRIFRLDESARLGLKISV